MTHATLSARVIVGEGSRPMYARDQAYRKLRIALT
jgi:hypothetical protein